ncbi:hypothetical protein ACWC09_40780 [Streptomyces sp. NPDC001617]
MTSGSRASWGRSLGYGLASGTLVFVLLGLVLGLLPVSDGEAALIMYVALVVPPALAARRFRPRHERRPRGDRRGLRPRPSPKPSLPRPPRRTAAEAADRAITSYGDLLRLHTYRPGPSADPDDLADYRTALEAYDEARASAPGRVPELLERGRAALERLDTARFAATDISWIHGTGDTKVRMPWPVGGGPALLVFETDGGRGDVSGGGRGGFSMRGDGGFSGSERDAFSMREDGDFSESERDTISYRERDGFSVHELGLPGTRARELFKGAYDAWDTEPGRARVLLPARRGGELLLDVWAVGPWRIALRPPGEARRLEEDLPLTGLGIETVLKDSGCRVVEFAHQDAGAFAVHEVTRSYRTGRLLAEGRGAARLTVAVPEGRRVLRIDADGRWTLRHPGTPRGGHPAPE